MPPGLRRVAAWPIRAWPLFAFAALAGLAWLIWESRTPILTPRHRPEALCFALAETRYAPPMTVESGAAVVRGRFNERTPADVAVREAMQFTEDMVIQERPRRVGDFDVDVLWLRIPGGGHWLVLAWMEESELALASFRFDSDQTDLSADELLWGDRLIHRVLEDDLFRAGTVPSIRLRAPGGAAPRFFGPKPID